MKRITLQQLKRRMVAILSLLQVMIMVTTITCNISFAASKTRKNVTEPTVNAGSYIVMSGSTSEVILEEDSETKLNGGNIVKLMTAMVVLDNMYDDSELKNSATVDANVDKYGEMFTEGESATVKDMLAALLIAGSNEAGEALARYSASERGIFIREMNSKAVELGLMDTQFENPTGKKSVNQYMTAKDAGKILQAALRYPVIRELLGKDQETISVSSNKKNRSLVVTGTDPLLSSSKKSEVYKYSNGGVMSEMPSEDDAEATVQYAGAAEQDDMELIVVMLGETSENTARDAKALFKYGFAKVTKNTIVPSDKKVGRARIKGGASTKVDAYTAKKGYAYIPPEGSTNLVKTETVIFDDLKAPLNAGDKVGEYRIYVADELKGTVDLVTKKEVKLGWFPSKIYISNLATTIIVTIIVLFVAFSLRIMAVKKRRAKLREIKRQQMIREAARKQLELEEDRRRRNWTYSK